MKSSLSMSRSKAATKKKWAIYTYIAGDNNLSNEGLIDIAEMEDAGSSVNTHVAVQIDTTGVHDGSIRYEISEPDFEGRSHRIEIQRLPEQNTGEPKHLAKFATWAGSRYPASKKVLVVWNHGAGFMHEPTRDIAYDDSSEGDALTMGELRWALTKAGFGAPLKGKISILGFDACLMNMLEVVYEFIGVADVVVGSQQTEPGDGWPYSDVIRGLSGDSRAVARNIVAKYIAYYRTAGTSGVTQSAVELRKLAPLGAAVNRLGKELRQRLPDAKPAILHARLNTQGYEEPTYVDLVDLTEKLKARMPDTTMAAACDAVQVAVKHAVFEADSFGASVKRSHGLSIWFPAINSDYVERRAEYVALLYSARFKEWHRFLDAMLTH